MILLVPAYGSALLNSAVALAPKLKGKLAVIINPDSGPGRKRDDSIARALQELRKQGAVVWFYLDCVAGPGFSAAIGQDGAMLTPGKLRNKTRYELKREVDRYKSFYGEPSPTGGWFLDDSTNKIHQSEAAAAVPPLDCQLWNPGNVKDSTLFDFDCDSVCYFEGEFFAENRPKASPLRHANGVVLSLNDREWRLSFKAANDLKAKYFFATDAKGDPWKAAPSYFAAMAEEVLKTRD